MQYLGDKLTTAQAQVSGWVGNVRRSLQGALDLVSGALQQQRGRPQQEGDTEEEDAGSGGQGRFQRAVMPLRSFASRSRRSLRSLSLRGRQRLSSRKRPANGDAEKRKSALDETRVQDTDALIPDSEPHDDTQEPDNRPDTPEKAEAEPESEAEDDLKAEVGDDVEGEGEPEVESEGEGEGEGEVEDDAVDSDHPSEPELPPFPELTAPLLDSSVLRSRVELGKRRSTRTRPPKASRHSAALPTVQEGPTPDWRFCDTADGKATSLKVEESSSEDEQPREKEPCLPPSQPKRVALPVMDAAALKARILGSKKRSGEGATGGGGGGGGGGGSGGGDGDSQTDGPAPSPPVPPARTRGPRVLPPVGAKEGGASPSPAWLKELKSKQRLSQPGQSDSDA